ncbi:AraC family transcriptional regulator [Pseudomaricurvus alkylphenolicus]|uniref:AraC family transcriptional regulator n=1 Tax=Pseudomaricurvus alkylphenolicus TaxID=1306991 RepID=UPI00142329A5|nr:AraC family transcriptional regulator [Pseudomaricurvus alkylphenolicus]NIB42423.1 AraC family transcriptional regulator [Pseudomaricurvus alkylphenolicus]
MSTAEKISVCAMIVVHSLEGMRQAGHDIPSLLKRCDISEKQLKKPKARVPVEKVVKLARLCSYQAKDELNCSLERPFLLGHFRIVALSLLQTRTLGCALQRLTEIYNLFDNSFRYSMNIGANQVEFRIERIAGHRIVNDHAIDSALLVAHRVVGWLCNERIILNQVTLDFPPPDYRAEYRHIYYGAPVLFKQPHNAFFFDTSYLDHPIVQNEASTESYARRAPLDLYLPMDAGGVLTQTVRTLIKQAFARHNAPPEFEQIATQMKYKPHTLRRRLGEEGTSFHTIKSQVRRDIAIHHLGDPETSIEQIAVYAGYAEPSAFIRAFKSWTGFTPLQFRKGLEIE